MSIKVRVITMKVGRRENDADLANAALDALYEEPIGDLVCAVQADGHTPAFECCTQIPEASCMGVGEKTVRCGVGSERQGEEGTHISCLKLGGWI